MASQALTLRKGPWLEEEDERLRAYVTLMGERRWDSLASVSGLRRSGKSCRLRWLNYLHPDLKHGPITSAEEHIILQLQQLWGNKWSKIARSLPGRTDNEIKNYWRSHLRKKTQAQEQEEQEKLQPEIENTTTTLDDIVTQVNMFGATDYAFAASPYENHIWDCISEAMPIPMHAEDTWYCNQVSSSDEEECWAGLWNTMHGAT